MSTSRGAYSFESVIPGHYPDRICQHTHYLVTEPGHKTLVTQLYFATDPVFDGDPAKNYSRDPLLQTPELIRPVMLTGDPDEVHAKVQFELCLERL
jgi:protocatechuate 3,4-dioxygenase beta subunit